MYSVAISVLDKTFDAISLLGVLNLQSSFISSSLNITYRQEV